MNQPSAPPLSWTVPVLMAPALKPAEARLVVLEPGKPLEISATDLSPPKVNAGSVGYFRVLYEDAIFAKLLKASTTLPEADRLNLLSDSFALAQADRVPLTQFLQLATRLARDDSYPVISKITGSLLAIDGLLRGQPEREAYRTWARNLLRPAAEPLGWEVQPGETALNDLRRHALLRTLGILGERNVIQAAQERFTQALETSEKLAGNLRDTVWMLVGQSATAAEFAALHRLARATDSVEEKRGLYGAMAAVRNPGLVQTFLAISLTDELPPQQAAMLLPRMAEANEHPEAVWEFARKNMPALLGKLSAWQTSEYVPAMFTPYSDAAHAEELETWTKANLPPSALPEAEKVADLIRFRAEWKTRVVPQLAAWSQAEGVL